MTENQTYENGARDAQLKNIQQTVDRIEAKLDLKVDFRDCSRRHRVIWIVLGGVVTAYFGLVGWVLLT